MAGNAQIIQIEGNQIDSEQAFVDHFCQSLGLSSPPLTLISALTQQLAQRKDPLTVVWLHAEASKNVMVRKSDVRIEDLPKDGSLMQRDIILASVWEKQSLLEKAIGLFRGLPHVDLQLA